jgi:hypothetical protein
MRAANVPDQRNTIFEGAPHDARGVATKDEKGPCLMEPL